MIHPSALEPAAAPQFSASPAQPPVFLLHGIFHRGRQMRRLRALLAAAGRTVYTPDLTPNDGSAGIPELAAQVRDYIDERVAPGQPCDLVGYSMGGLVARTYAQWFAPRGRVRRLVTLAAPHHGSLLAWFWAGAGALDMRPDSPFLRDLAGDTPRLAEIPVTSLWTPYDLVIVPSNSSVLPVGRNFGLRLPHHRALITHRAVLHTVGELLAPRAAALAATPPPRLLWQPGRRGLGRPLPRAPLPHGLEQHQRGRD